MGRKSSIDEATGQKLIEASQRGKSRREMAAEFDLSIGSVNRYFESLPKAAAPVVAQQRHIVETAGASLWNTWAALEESYHDIAELVEQLKAGIQLIKVDGEGKEYTTFTPPSTLVAAIKEKREHIQTSAELQKLLIHIDETRKFQEAVLEALGEADPDLRQRAIAILKDRRAMGLALFQPTRS